MGLLDGAFDNFQGGILPNWLTTQLQNIQPQDLLKLQSILAPQSQQKVPQQDSVLPQNAQPASGSIPLPKIGGSMPGGVGLWTPPDAAPDSPPVNPNAPLMNMPTPIGAPAPMQQPSQAMPGMAAMAQASQQQQPPQQSGGNPIGAIGGRLMDFLGGTLATGNPMAGVSVALNQGKKQQIYDALVAQGIPAEKAYFIVNSPEAGKMGGIITEQTKPSFSVIGHDSLGNAQYGFVNAASQTVAPYQPPATANAPASDLTGEDFLKTLPPGMASQVKAIVEGRQQPPGGFALKSPAIQAMLQAAAQYEPGFDLTKWTARAAGHKDFYGGGKSAEMVRAANQTIHHVGALIDSMDKLNNTQYPQYNAIGNYVNKEILGTGAVTEFLPNAHAVAEEMSKVFKGANLSDAEIRQWEASLNPNMSPEQQRAAVGKLVQLLNGSLEALENKRRSSLGDALADQKGPLLDDKSKETMKKVEAWMSGQKPAETTAPAATAAPSAPTATGPNGQKLILQNGQWVPMK